MEKGSPNSCKMGYVPPVAIRVLRDLTRYRTKLVRYQSSTAKRIQRRLERCNVKLASVASDVLGGSGQAMLRALAAGETNSLRMGRPGQEVTASSIHKLTVDGK